MPDPREVQSMFARIAGRYDLLNHALSMGIDKGWRRATVAAAGPLQGELVVDVCTGTGDLALAFAKAGARVLGVDFTAPMLARAARKGGSRRGRCGFVRGDALMLPVVSGRARAASVAFGLRNVADPSLALRELARVLAPGGKALVLEFSIPRGRLIGPLYRHYFRHWLPRIGALVSGDGDAYDYLPRTVQAWLEPEELRRLMEQAGFVDCGWRPLTHGIACLHWGSVRGDS